MNKIELDIYIERQVQDAKWGGKDHDLDHSNEDWIRYIMDHAKRASASTIYRKQLVRVAALAVAALEAHDTIMHNEAVVTCMTKGHESDNAWCYASCKRCGEFDI